MNKNRFKELLRSTLGDVRPLVSEQGETPPFIPQTPRTSSTNPGGPKTLPDTLPNSIIEPEVPSSKPPEQPNDGKKDLIKILRNHLNSMENNKSFSGMGVAQVMYNDCAHWMNKTLMFKNRPGEPLNTEAPFAPEE